MSTFRPVWCVMPHHAPLTPQMLKDRQITPFDGWRIYPYNRATGSPDTSLCILDSNEAATVAQTLKGLQDGAGHDSAFVLGLPILPEEEGAWQAADLLFFSVVKRRSPPCDCEIKGADCEHVSLHLPYVFMNPMDLIGLCNGLTETIHEDIGDYDEPQNMDEEAFLNHRYAPLREELCEISGYYGE